MRLKQLIAIIFFFSFSCFYVSAQNDTLNEINSKGKKQGYWLSYFDSNFKTSDSTNASYAAFDLYHNGQMLTLDMKSEQKTWRKALGDSLLPVSYNYNNKEYKLLNGKISFYDKNNNLIKEAFYKKGHMIRFDGYHNKKDSCLHPIQGSADFTKLYNNQPGSFYYEFTFCDGKKKIKYWFRKIEGSEKYSAHTIKE